jgi:nitric oxide reductase subunit C
LRIILWLAPERFVEAGELSQRTLKYILIFGTIAMFAVMIALTASSLSQVTKTRTAALTDQVVAGKKVWQKRNCDDCHTIYGIGGYFAPELTKETDRRDSTWLTSFLSSPEKAKPGTTMPDQKLDSTQVSDLISFLKWVSETNTNNWPPAPLVQQPTTTPTGTTLSGNQVMQQLGCFGCHAIGTQGSFGPGPNLTHIGGTPYDSLPNTADFLNLWLINPSAQKPTTGMPQVPMTDAQRAAIVSYLVSLK